MLLPVLCKGQLADNFSDGNLSHNPPWTGDTAAFMINPQLQLQSNHTIANSFYQVSTASSLATAAQWDFTCNLLFNPSGSNYTDVFLTASESDLTAPSTKGYFVRIGGTDDDISLYRKDSGSVSRIIDGENGILNSSSNNVRISVVRDLGNNWVLFRNHNATGLFTEGNASDATYLNGSFFGLLVRQSTSGFFQKHFFDDISAVPYVPDLTPPQLVSCIAINATTLDILFNEPVSLASSQQPANYEVSNGIGFPLSATRDPLNPAKVRLVFTNSFPIRTNLSVQVNAVADLAGNTISPASVNFSYVIALPYDILVDELMADPSPPVALPEYEWVELTNTSVFDINLKGWRLQKPTSQSGPMPEYILKPDSFVIVCAAGAATAMSAYGPVISLSSFPSLANTGDEISLLSDEGKTIHTVNYSDEWYQNELKKAGGWSLEMVDTGNPCTGFSNWAASSGINGGTPGKRNAAAGVNADTVSPKLMRAYATDSVTLLLVFNEPLDSIQASSAARYQISDGAGSPLSASALPGRFNRVMLTLAGSAALQRNRVYSVTVNALADCSGNTIGQDNSARVALFEQAGKKDMVINEILFNPLPNGNDYVEIYNRGNQVLNLRNTYVACRNTSGAITGIRQLSVEDYLFFPGDFIVITEKATLVLDNYVAMKPDAFLEVSDLPSFNDDKGQVVLLDEQGNVIDEVAYNESWHFKLISNKEGISLERIDYEADSNDEQNWHSAAASVHYGTPTYKNSQAGKETGVTGEVMLVPEIISPDNDGLDDYAQVVYSFPEPGYVCNITIFDASGRIVRHLEHNSLCGLSGSYRWDGLGEKSGRLLQGIYIVLTEVYNLKGKSKKYKNVIVLARKTD